MYIKKSYYCGKVLEVEKIQTFRYKSKHTVRAPQTNPTPEAQAVVNERNSIKNLARLINTNFKHGDWHLSLTYARENRASSPQEAKADLAKFLRNVKLASKRRGKSFYYIAVSEYGEHSMHHHVVMHCELSLEEVQSIWSHGRIRISVLDNKGDYTQLAKYLVKQTRKTYNDPERRVHAKRYCQSKNLRKPIVKIEKVTADSWREIPSAPRGYYVLPDSIVQNVSDITGYPYQYYKCLLLNEAT